MLIRGCELRDARVTDVRITGDRIAAIGSLTPGPDERVIDAQGGLLLPGLHDHHIHLAAWAAALGSVDCGPPAVADAAEFGSRLARPGDGWLRGVGYHESVAGNIDARALDCLAPDRPVRIQHRSGRMWIFNSAGLAAVLAGTDAPAGFEHQGGRLTGRLFDCDDWLRTRLHGRPPGLSEVGARLAGFGVTGVTEISPANDGAVARHLDAERRSGALPQRVLLAGSLSLSAGDAAEGIAIGPFKVHLHEAAPPDPDQLAHDIARAHAAGRTVAIHCATEVELVVALAALRAGGAVRGDRIEHASVAPDMLVEQIAALGLTVVTQPHFIAERGDAYRAAIPPAEWPHLYRLASLHAAGVALAGGSDAPFGGADPWAAMAAAVSRRTASGEGIGPGEALTPDVALDLFLGAPDAPGQLRSIAIGALADMCLLDRPWRMARERLSSALVRMTVIAGAVVTERPAAG